MALMYFYSDYQADDHVASEDQVLLESKEEFQAKMESVLAQEENFIGLFSEGGSTIQFMSLGEGMVLMDIPVVQQNGSYQQEMSLKGAVEIVSGVTDPVDITPFTKLPFESWEEDDLVDDA